MHILNAILIEDLPNSPIFVACCLINLSSSARSFRFGVAAYFRDVGQEIILGIRFQNVVKESR